MPIPIQTSFRTPAIAFYSIDQLIINTSGDLWIIFDNREHLDEYLKIEWLNLPRTTRTRITPLVIRRVYSFKKTSPKGNR